MTVLGDNTYQASQKRLREWLTLEETKISLFEATEHRDRESVANSLCLYVSVAFDVDKAEVENLPWKEVALAFDEGCKVNAVNLNHIAFIRDHKKQNKELWDYDGRTWWTWAHTLAKEFGWGIEYIAELQVAEAFPLLQEVLLDQQLQKEWEWNLSEYSVKYNTTTKKSDPNPLPRPDWMKMVAPESLTPAVPVKIPVEMLPVGNIIRYKDTKH